MINFGGDKTCAICAAKYRSWLTGAMQEFCEKCRQEFKIDTINDAESMLALIDDIPKTQRDKAAVKLLTDLEQEEKGKKGKKAKALPAASTQPTSCQLNPELMKAASRMLISYGRLADDTSPYTQPTSYVIAKNGLFEVQHTDVATFAILPKVVRGVDVEMKEGMHLNVPKVPYAVLSQVVAFFREVSKDSSNEAYVQVWWNRNEQQYHLHVPPQEVSGGSVVHHSVFDREGARNEDGSAVWLLVLEVHSHGSSMGAFWSGTDDHDESNAPPGRLLGVIGNVKQSIPTWRWRVRTSTGFIDIGVTDVFDIDPDRVASFTVSWKVIMSCLKDATKDGTINLSCPVDPFHDATFPAEWMQQVTMHKWARQVHSSVNNNGWSGQQKAIDRPEYIYILTNGTTLKEYKVDGGKPTPTGRVLELNA